MVYPSGSDLATNSAAMAPLAPGLFSTTAGWPRNSWNFQPMARPTRSEEPPGTNGITTRIGLDGKVCAPAVTHATRRQSEIARRLMSWLTGEGRQFSHG